MSTTPRTGGSDVDIVAAIDQAVRDGVDVINYSIGTTGGGDPFTDAVNLAFMNAASAGIFVATSAGNDGPGLDRRQQRPVDDHHRRQHVVPLPGRGRARERRQVRRRDGEQRAVSEPPARLRRRDVANGADPEEAALCGPDSLDPAQADGTIVVCDRGVYDRVAKSAEVARAGGVGMVLANVTPAAPTPTSTRCRPCTSTCPTPTRSRLRDRSGRHGVARPGPRRRHAVPQLAGFSSRGPAVPGGGDILKPDIAAPGVSIVAAVAPPCNSGREWDLYSGTSMASPHIAGLAAFIHRLAALVAGDDQVGDDDDGVQPGGRPPPVHAGRRPRQPEAVPRPGPGLRLPRLDWLNFLAGQGVTTGDGDPLTPNPIDASDLNLPSIGIGDLVGGQTVTRRVTNVSGKPETYRSTRGPAGLDIVAPHR